MHRGTNPPTETIYAILGLQRIVGGRTYLGWLCGNTISRWGAAPRLGWGSGERFTGVWAPKSSEEAPNASGIRWRWSPIATEAQTVTRTWIRGGGGFVHTQRGGGAVDDVGSGIRGRKWGREAGLYAPGRSHEGGGVARDPQRGFRIEGDPPRAPAFCYYSRRCLRHGVHWQWQRAHAHTRNRKGEEPRIPRTTRGLLPGAHKVVSREKTSVTGGAQLAVTVMEPRGRAGQLEDWQPGPAHQWHITQRKGKTKWARWEEWAETGGIRPRRR
jgi:hypothetical protein